MPILEIPLIDVAADKEPSLVALAAYPERLALLLASARKTYTPIGFHVADELSRKWARKIKSPYNDAVAEVDCSLGERGAYLLNHSYEWGCTTGVAEDRALGGPTLLRTLDWPFDGLGQALVVTRSSGQAGPYVSLTWPGFVGVLTGSAPGRFSAAINQPPLPAPWGRFVGWPVARYRVGRSADIPPSHLLRLAFDQCRTFDEAVWLLRTTPICIPAIFTVAGINPGDSVTIERTERQALSPRQPAAANHWASEGSPAGRPRDELSLPRRDAMCELMKKDPDWTLGWLRAPILVGETRLVVMANALSGRLVAQGLEKSGPATRLLTLRE